MWTYWWMGFLTGVVLGAGAACAVIVWAAWQHSRAQREAQRELAQKVAGDLSAEVAKAARAAFGSPVRSANRPA